MATFGRRGRAAQECAPRPPSVHLQHTRARPARRDYPVAAPARTRGELHSERSARRGTHEGEHSSQGKRPSRSIDGKAAQYKTEKDAPSIEKNSKGQHLSPYTSAPSVTRGNLVVPTLSDYTLPSSPPSKRARQGFCSLSSPPAEPRCRRVRRTAGDRPGLSPSNHRPAHGILD